MSGIVDEKSLKVSEYLNELVRDGSEKQLAYILGQTETILRERYTKEKQ